MLKWNIFKSETTSTTSYVVFVATAENKAIEIQKLKDGKFDKLLASESPQSDKPSHYFRAHFKTYTSLADAGRKLGNHSKQLENVYILEITGDISNVEGLAAKGQFSAGIKNVLNGAEYVAKLVCSPPGRKY